MLPLHITNETSRLKAVVLGTAFSNGPTPKVEEAYDPKSLEHILAGTYPLEADMIKEMEAFLRIFEKYNVKVFRPEIISDYNQIFSRDIGFVIDDVFVVTGTFEIKFLKPITEGKLVAIGEMTKNLGSKLEARAKLYSENGDLYARGSGVFVKTKISLTSIEDNSSNLLTIFCIKGKSEMSE
jgi:N-dimethylarginine dimethylaminohydrolase